MVDCHSTPAAIVTEPPKLTAEPFIVIAEFCNFAFVTALAEIFAVVTALSGKVKVPLDASKVAPAGTETVSPLSPTVRLVPDFGTI
jgi:hypothetical protein